MKVLLERLMDAIESKRNQGPVDFQKLSVKFTLDAIGMIAFDANLGGLDGSRNIYQSLIDLGVLMAENALNPFMKMYCKLFPRSEAARKRDDLSNQLKDQWNQLTNEILERSDPTKDEARFGII